MIQLGDITRASRYVEVAITRIENVKSFRLFGKIAMNASRNPLRFFMLFVDFLTMYFVHFLACYCPDIC